VVGLTWSATGEDKLIECKFSLANEWLALGHKFALDHWSGVAEKSKF